MDKLSRENMQMIKRRVIIAIFVIVLITIIAIIFKYNIEGEKNTPFKITSIRVASTVESKEVTDNVGAEIIQINDFYFYIEENENYNKEDSITKITFNNFNIEKPVNKGIVKMYSPSENNAAPYTYTDEYKVENEISYKGALKTNLPGLEISNQGGLIGFSIAIDQLGSCNFENVVFDGTILPKMNISNEEISMKVSFDVIMETNSKNKFKTTLEFDLPSGNIIEEGKFILDKDNLDNIVYKRVK